MIKHAIGAALLVFWLTTLVDAQSLQPPLVGPNPTPAIPTMTPDTPPAASVLQESDAAVPEEPVSAECGCQTGESPLACAAPPHRPTWREQCAYYRSVRQAFDRGPCCADYYGGFGPLWDSYCADRQRPCCAAAGACGPAAACPSCRRVLGAHRGRLLHSQSCCNAGCDGGGISTDEGAPPGAGPQEASDPPPPTPGPEARAAPPQLSPPAVPVSTGPLKSARRAWQNRTVVRHDGK